MLTYSSCVVYQLPVQYKLCTLHLSIYGLFELSCVRLYMYVYSVVCILDLLFIHVLLLCITYQFYVFIYQLYVITFPPCCLHTYNPPFNNTFFTRGQASQDDSRKEGGGEPIHPDFSALFLSPKMSHKLTLLLQKSLFSPLAASIDYWVQSRTSPCRGKQRSRLSFRSRSVLHTGHVSQTN